MVTPDGMPLVWFARMLDKSRTLDLRVDHDDAERTAHGGDVHAIEVRESELPALRRIAPRKNRAGFCHSHPLPGSRYLCDTCSRDRILFDRPTRFPAYSAAVSTG
jgi:hypothetical protein